MKPLPTTATIIAITMLDPRFAAFIMMLAICLGTATIAVDQILQRRRAAATSSPSIRLLSYTCTACRISGIIHTDQCEVTCEVCGQSMEIDNATVKI